MRPAPRLFDRLPEQYFTRILAAAAAARAQDGPGVRRFIDLGRGNPDLPPPPHAIEALRAAALETSTPAVHGYPPFDGQRDLREAIAARYAADHGVDTRPRPRGRRRARDEDGDHAGLCRRGRPRRRDPAPGPGLPRLPIGGRARGGDREARWHSRRARAGSRTSTRSARRAPGARSGPELPVEPVRRRRASGHVRAAVAWCHERDAWLIHDLAYGFLAFDGRRARERARGRGRARVSRSSSGRRRRSTGWPAGGSASRWATPSSSSASRRCWTTPPRASSRHPARPGSGAARRPGRRRRAPRGLPRPPRPARRDAARGRGQIDAPEGTFYAWWRLPAGLTPERLLPSTRRCRARARASARAARAGRDCRSPRRTPTSPRRASGWPPS